MTVRLSAAQAEVIGKIKRGNIYSPPLPLRVLTTLIQKGLVAEGRRNGSVFYYLTDEGKRF